METVTEKNLFEVTWAEGYPPVEKRLVGLDELSKDFEGSWNLSDEFIQQLRASEVDEVVTYSDLSGTWSAPASQTDCRPPQTHSRPAPTA